MSRPLLLGLALLLAVSAGSGAKAETCSSSTLVSNDFAVARWCGDPPAPGRLRMVRRGGRAEEFLNVPLDTYREVVRTPHVAQYVADDIAPRFERQAAAPEPAPATRPRPRAAGEGAEVRSARLRHVAARPSTGAEAERTEASSTVGSAPSARRHRHRRPVEDEQTGAERPATNAKEASRTAARRARQAARALEERDR
ncbi:hypothetical protein D9599_11830 [Roseomonas sp. KE2513]|uniref:hypothetical protein n=1 Tax=Roseomonas sp. KE2513 TaxID=2479202 RepID=UPI0018DF1712|nr:hypothetical protein [Roseomonas sp. KE2513]MBI0536266.1 hypothetical protein [Roseomonas sp. KE2513]